MDTVEYLRATTKSQILQGHQTVEKRSYFVETSTRTGFAKLARWSLATFVVIVAEYKYVVRSFGMALRIASISAPKSISNKRSASSRTCGGNKGDFSLLLIERVQSHGEKVKEINKWVV